VWRSDSCSRRSQSRKWPWPCPEACGVGTPDGLPWWPGVPRPFGGPLPWPLPCPSLFGDADCDCPRCLPCVLANALTHCPTLRKLGLGDADGVPTGDADGVARTSAL